MDKRRKAAIQLVRDMHSVADRMDNFSYHTFSEELKRRAKEIDDLFAKERCPSCGHTIDSDAR